LHLPQSKGKTMSGETLTPRVMLSIDGQGSLALKMSGGESCYCPALLAKAENKHMLLVVPVEDADGGIAAFAASLEFLANKLGAKGLFSRKVCLPSPEDPNASNSKSCSVFTLANKVLPEAAKLNSGQNKEIITTLNEKLFGSRRDVAFVAGILPSGNVGHYGKAMMTSETNEGVTDVVGHNVSTLQFRFNAARKPTGKKFVRVDGLAIAQVGGDLGEVLKVVREGLTGASRVLDDDRDAGARHEAEGHRHAVVVVGVDGHTGLHLLGRGNHAIVPKLLDLDSMNEREEARCRGDQRIETTPPRSPARSAGDGCQGLLCSTC
jgi:hypothetical protein